MNILQTIGKGVAGVGLFLASLLGYHQPQNLGATVYKPVPRYESSLALPLPAAQTSTMTMVSGVDGNGQTLSGPMCFTIDSGVAGKVEDVCGIASGTIVSALQRGTDTSGYNASSTLAHDHRVGADVKTTDSPYLAQMYGLLNGSQTFPNVLSYDPSFPSSTVGSSIYNIPSVGYVIGVATSGAPDASICLAGFVCSALPQFYKGLIGLVIPNGTSSVTDGAQTLYNVIPVQYFKSIYQGATTVGVLTSSTGVIDPSFLSSSTAVTYKLGNITVPGSSTLSVPIFPNATTSVIATNASGTGYAAGKGASTGSQLTFNNGVWQAGFPFASTSTSQSNTTTTNRLLLSIPLPSAASTSIYEYTYQFNVPNGPASNATFTVALAGNGVTTTLQTVNTITNCAAGPAFCAAVMGGRIINQGSNISQYDLIYPPVGLGDGFSSSSPSIFGTNVSSLNLGVSPSINFYIQAATSTSITVSASGTLIMYQ